MLLRIHKSVLLLLLPVLCGCFGSFNPPRAVTASDIALPEGYRIEPVVTGLAFPTGIAFDDNGRVYITESGVIHGETRTAPRLLRMEPGGKTTVIATGDENRPWSGVAYYKGAFYVTENGEFEGGSILRITPDGAITRLAGNLPALGDHHTSGPVLGPDEWMYFGQGTATNSGVVGEDNLNAGWLRRYPDYHDIPCRDIRLNGYNFETKDFPAPYWRGKIITGAFSPFGAVTKKGQIIKGEIPCSGAVLRINPGGGALELVAWGFRNPRGFAFSPDGRLFVTDRMYDKRGSRPVSGTGDILWDVKEGTWYGWPDFHGNRPLNGEPGYRPRGGPSPEFLLAQHPNIPPKPTAVFAVHSSPEGLDFSRKEAFGFVGQAFVAQAGKAFSQAGCRVVRVDTASGDIEEFAANKGKPRPGAGGMEHPVAVRFDPPGSALYVVDAGFVPQGARAAGAQEGTGVLWRITRTLQKLQTTDSSKTAR
ncbi:MAG TPA: hypothetical protein VF790_01530 [Dissulfurispiraceae bacterium]